MVCCWCGMDLWMGLIMWWLGWLGVLGKRWLCRCLISRFEVVGCVFGWWLVMVVSVFFGVVWLVCIGVCLLFECIVFWLICLYCYLYWNFVGIFIFKIIGFWVVVEWDIYIFFDGVVCWFWWVCLLLICIVFFVVLGIDIYNLGNWLIVFVGFDYVYLLNVVGFEWFWVNDIYMVFDIWMLLVICLLFFFMVGKVLLGNVFRLMSLLKLGCLLFGCIGF